MMDTRQKLKRAAGVLLALVLRRRGDGTEPI